METVDIFDQLRRRWTSVFAEEVFDEYDRKLPELLEEKKWNDVMIDVLKFRRIFCKTVGQIDENAKKTEAYAEELCKYLLDEEGTAEESQKASDTLKKADAIRKENDALKAKIISIISSFSTRGISSDEFARYVDRRVPPKKRARLSDDTE